MTDTTYIAGAKVKPYRPQPKLAEILDWCWNRLKSVPFDPTLRWLFYRLLDEKLRPTGIVYTAKQKAKQYIYFIQYTSRARKGFYKNWTPNTIKDDTRSVVKRGYGYESDADWFKSFNYERCMLSKFENQDNIVELWFEAGAMLSQFDYYTRPYYLTLRPFKGDYSVEKKWRAAKDVEDLAVAYPGKPIKILYFGDYDKKGKQIPDSVVKDIRKWCSVPFDFIRVGLNKEHVEQWNLLESWDREPKFQWESLSETQAQSLIVNAIEKYWSLEKVREKEKLEEEATRRWRKFLLGEREQ